MAQTTLLTLLIKGAFFVIGVLIVGAFETRSVLLACSSSPSSPPVFQFDAWYHLEAYTDYRDLYLRCLVAPFLNTTFSGAFTQNHNIYYLGTIVYNYPPLFLYLLGGVAALSSIIWAPAIPLVLFDILTVIPVYLIARDFFFHGNEKQAFVVALFWAANPINLFYIDLMWLNTGPTTFFLLLAVYLFLKQRWVLSSLMLAISTGFKQISFILFPVFLIFLWRATGFSRKLVAYAAAYILAVVLISTPYVFTQPQNYFWSLGFPIFGIPSGCTGSCLASPTFSESLSDPVRITTFFGVISSSAISFVNESYLYLNYVLVAVFAIMLLYLIIKSVNYIPSANFSSGPSVPTRGVYARIREFINDWIRLLKNLKVKKTLSANDVVVFCLVGLLIFLSFFARGVYKYYFASVTPLSIPIFRNKFGALLFEVISLTIFLAPREVTPWMAALMLTMLPRMLENPSHKSEVNLHSLENSQSPS